MYWNIIESGVKHHNPNPSSLLLMEIDPSLMEYI